MTLKHTLLAGAALLSVASCQQSNKSSTAENAPARKMLDPANMDTTVRPGDNFFMYANGAWLKKNPIPASETRWGSFNELQENNYRILHGILDSAAAIKDPKAGSREQKVGDFYRTGMDSATIEKAGITPLNDIFARIDAIKDANGAMSEVALEQTQGIGQLFGFGVGPDDKNVKEEICQFGQGGLGLPDRDYYFDKDAQTVKVRDAYKQYLPSMFKLMGEDEATAKKDADAVYNLETKLASASMTRVEQRNPYNVYHKFNLDGINKATPGIDWKALFQGLKINGQDSLLVGMPKFFAAVGKELKATPLDVWKKYMKFHVLNGFAPYLDSKTYGTYFGFYGKTLRGQQEPRPRWKRVLNVVDGSIGELLGQLYVDKTFKPSAKQRMLDLVNNLQQTYAERIQRLDWMTDSTKRKAVTKLNAFMKKIGYPDKWKD